MSRATAPFQTEQERFLGHVADTVRRRGWRLPALIALEAGRPLAFLAGQLLYVAQPALALVWPHETVGRLARLLEDPAAVDSLIEYLDTEQAHG